MGWVFKWMGGAALAASVFGCSGGSSKGGADAGPGPPESGVLDLAAEPAPAFVAPPMVESTIGPAGGTVSIPGYADVTFPAGAFAEDQMVRLEVTSDAALADLFRSSTAIFGLGGHAPYEVVATVGTTPPLAPATVHLIVPDELRPSAAVGAYSDLLTASDEDTLEQFEPVATTSRDDESLTLALPADHFEALGIDGRLETVLVLATGRDATAAGTATRAGSACGGVVLGPPLATVAVTSPFDPTRSVTIVDAAGNAKTFKGHFGADYRAAVGTVVYAAGDGTVVLSESSPTFGETLVIDMGGKGDVRYAHLMRRDVAVRDQVCQGQPIGLSDTTGLVKGPHLHFEYAPSGDFGSNAAQIDPTPCIDPSMQVPQRCARWTGTIHVVEAHGESTQQDDNAMTVTDTSASTGEHLWTLGENHPGDLSSGETMIDLTWAGSYEQHDKTVTTYKFESCPEGSRIEEMTATGSGSKPSQLVIVEVGGERSLGIVALGNVLSWPSTTTITDCVGGVTVEPPGSVALVEYVSLVNAPALTMLQPSPGDPNEFTGMATLFHDEEPQTGGMSVDDVKVDWNIHRNPNF